MSKEKTARVLKDNQAKAMTRSLRVTPQKLNLVATMIRGKSASQALIDLTFSKRRIAHSVKKTLQSAIANAEENHQLDADLLVVREAYVSKSLLMKRFRARARGRGARINKFFSNLTIIVEEVEEQV